MTESDFAEQHLYRDFTRPDPNGKGLTRCWCGWTTRTWNENVGYVAHQEHLREMALRQEAQQ